MPDFESFSKELVPSRSSPTVTIQRRGALSMNRAAYRALDTPQSVELLFDRDKRIIGLRAIDPHAENAYAVRPAATTSGPYVVSAMAFVRHYEIDTSISRRWPAYVDDGVLCIDLDSDAGATAPGAATPTGP